MARRPLAPLCQGSSAPPPCALLVVPQLHPTLGVANSTTATVTVAMPPFTYRRRLAEPYSSFTHPWRVSSRCDRMIGLAALALTMPPVHSPPCHTTTTPTVGSHLRPSSIELILRGSSPSQPVLPPPPTIASICLPGTLDGALFHLIDALEPGSWWLLELGFANALIQHHDAQSAIDLFSVVCPWMEPAVGLGGL